MACSDAVWSAAAGEGVWVSYSGVSSEGLRGNELTRALDADLVTDSSCNEACLGDAAPAKVLCLAGSECAVELSSEGLVLRNLLPLWA